MINLYKKREHNSKSNEIKLDSDAIKISNEQFKHAQRVEDSIQTYFESTTEANRLRLLDEKSMLAALTEFIDKDEVYSLSTMVEAQIEQSQKFLLNNIHNDDVAFLEEELKRFKTLQNADDDQAIKRRKDLLTIARQERLKVNGDKSSDDETTQSMEINNDDEDDDDEDDRKPTQTTTRGRGRGRGRGRAKTTPRGKRKPF